VKKRSCLLWLPVALSLALLGCDRTHMSASFGVANRAAFEKQVIHPHAGDQARPDQPLDPEEAAVIARTYQRSLAPKETADQAGRASPLLVAPPPEAAPAAGSAR